MSLYSPEIPALADSIARATEVIAALQNPDDIARLGALSLHNENLPPDVQAAVLSTSDGKFSCYGFQSVFPKQLSS